MADVETKEFDGGVEVLSEPTDVEIILRSQDGSEYLEFSFPITVVDSDTWNSDAFRYSVGDCYVLSCGEYDYPIGKYRERKHAIHVMNYILAKRNYYKYEGKIRSVIIEVPTDETVRQTPDEFLLDGVPVREQADD